MKIGFVVAMESEYEPFLSKLGLLQGVEVVAGVEFCIFCQGPRVVVLAKCGIGEIAAASATALLIGHFSCDYIFNFGLVGSLDGSIPRSLVAIRDVVHYDSDLTPFGHPLGAPADRKDAYIKADLKLLGHLEKLGLSSCRLASGDKFIADSKIKNLLKSEFSANVCDMEGAGVALTASRAKIPFAMIKLVSDGADEGAVKEYSLNKGAAFDFAVNAVVNAWEVL